MKFKFKLWKLLLLTPAVMAPLTVVACGNDSKDPYRFPKPIINSDLIAKSSNLYKLFEDYVVQQKAAGKKIFVDANGWVPFYNDKNSNLFQIAKIYGNYTFFNFQTASEKFLTTILTNSGLTSPQQVIFSTAFNNLNTRFLMLMYSMCLVLRYDFTASKKSIIESKYALSNLINATKGVKNNSYLAQMLWIFFNISQPSQKLENDALTVSQTAANQLYAPICNFISNDPKKIKNNNFLAILLGNEWSSEPIFPSTSAIIANDWPKQTGDNYKFSYNFIVFNYKFQFQITFTYANAKVNYELTNFEVTKEA